MPNSSPGAFFVHWFELLCIATGARDRAKDVQTASPDAWPHEALGGIIFSTLAAEAFINELAEAAARDAGGQWMTGRPGVDLLRDLADTLDEIEDAQGTVGLKYQMASKILSGRTFDAGEALFQEFATLTRIRNEIVHPRHRDRTRPGGHIEPASAAIRNFGVPRAFRTIHPIGWAVWKGEIIAPTEEELLSRIQG